MRLFAFPKWTIALSAAVSCAAPLQPEAVAPGASGAPGAAVAPVAPLERQKASADAPPLVAESDGGVAVACTPRPDPIPLNEPFEVVLKVRDAAGRPIEGAQVFVTGWMPDHLHGMVRRPETVELGGGSYVARGMLFHMPGRWELRVDVLAGRRPERATFDVTL